MTMNGHHYPEHKKRYDPRVRTSIRRNSINAPMRQVIVEYIREQKLLVLDPPDQTGDGPKTYSWRDRYNDKSVAAAFTRAHFKVTDGNVRGARQMFFGEFPKRTAKERPPRKTRSILATGLVTREQYDSDISKLRDQLAFLYKELGATYPPERL